MLADAWRVYILLAPADQKLSSIISQSILFGSFTELLQYLFLAVSQAPTMVRSNSVVGSAFVHEFEPTLEEVNAQAARRPSAVQAMANQGRMGSTIGLQGNKKLTGASALTVKQSIVPVALVTCLFFVSLPGTFSAYTALIR